MSNEWIHVKKKQSDGNNCLQLRRGLARHSPASREEIENNKSIDLLQCSLCWLWLCRWLLYFRASLLTVKSIYGKFSVKVTFWFGKYTHIITVFLQKTFSLHIVKKSVNLVAIHINLSNNYLSITGISMYQFTGDENSPENSWSDLFKKPLLEKYLV